MKMDGRFKLERTETLLDDRSGDGKVCLEYAAALNLPRGIVAPALQRSRSIDRAARLLEPLS